MRGTIKRITVFIFVLFIFSFVSNYNTVFAGVSKDVGVVFGIVESGESTSETINKLKESFGYQSTADNEIAKTAKFITTITVSDNGMIKIGSGEYNVAFANEEQKQKLGYDGTNKTWDVVLIATTEEKVELGTGIEDIQFTIEEAYYGEDLQKGKDKKVESEAADLPHQEMNDTISKAKDIFDLVSNLKQHPGETIMSGVCWVIRGIADGIQMAVNLVQTVPEGTVGPITYSFEELGGETSDGGTQNTNNTANSSVEVNEIRKKYANVGNDESGADIVIPLNSDNEKEFIYDDGSTAEIPIIQGDIYSLAVGSIDALDVNFLNPDTEKHENTPWWTVVRNFATFIIRSAIFIAGGLLLASLIWNGINLTTKSLTPDQRKNHMEGLQKFAKSLLMLIGTVVIMAIGIYASNMFFDKVKLEKAKDGEMPIRVYVTETKQSFSTNAIGYVRYVAGIENVMLYETRMMHTLAYFGLVILNAIAVALMFVRMIAMLILSVMGPFVAISNIFNLEIIKMKYRDWVKLYLSWAFIQVGFALAYRIILTGTIIK